jgi:N-acetylmuramoyl-L-alanine amidase
MQAYRRGDHGPVIAEVRAKLARLGLLAQADGDVFDDAVDRAVRGFQQARGLRADGIVGPETYRALDEARWRLGDRLLLHAVTHPFVGDDVAELQQRLIEMGFDPGRCDGIFGRRTEAALREFQRNVGLPADGTCGPATLKSLERLRRTVTGGSPQAIREQERLMRSGPALAGKVVVLDPGHGGADRGAVGNGLEEAALVEDLAARIEGRLGALGVAAYLTRGADFSPADPERATFANDAAADLFISLHVDGAADPQCQGVATFFYGAAAPGSSVRSAAGERLATLLQREIVARTDLLDCHSHARTWELLRLTRMPAVRVEIGYATNPGDATRLASVEFRETVAEAVIAAVQRLYLPPERDVPTGQFRMPVLTR